MYRLVAIDLDGTMLNSYGAVSEKNQKMINEISNNNDIEVIIASGRPIDSIKTIAKELKNQKYFIAGNGATLYDMENDKILYEKYIKKSKALDIIKICEENSIFYNIYTEKEIVTKSLKYNILYYYKENTKKEENKKTRINIVSDPYKYIEGLEDVKILKIIVCDSTKAVFNSIIKKLRKIKDVNVIDTLYMRKKIIKQGTEDVKLEYFYTEILAEEVDKWNAIKILIDKLGILPNEVMAIGDNLNDKKMIEKSGLGIAMKGSTPSITEIADYVTQKSNDEDGVAECIEKFILNSN